MVAPPDAMAQASALLNAHGPYRMPPRIVAGGAERQDSVRHGLAAVGDVALVAIHDAARPFVAPATVAAVIEAARADGAAIVAIPATDTVKMVDPDDWIESTPPRARTWLAQTPQVFRTELIRAAHARGGDGDSAPPTTRRSSSGSDTVYGWSPAAPTTARSRRPTTWRGRSGI